MSKPVRDSVTVDQLLENLRNELREIQNAPVASVRRKHGHVTISKDRTGVWKLRSPKRSKRFTLKASKAKSGKSSKSER